MFINRLATFSLFPPKTNQHCTQCWVKTRRDSTETRSTWRRGKQRSAGYGHFPRPPSRKHVWLPANSYWLPSTVKSENSRSLAPINLLRTIFDYGSSKLLFWISVFLSPDHVDGLHRLTVRIFFHVLLVFHLELISFRLFVSHMLNI